MHLAPSLHRFLLLSLVLATVQFVVQCVVQVVHLVLGLFPQRSIRVGRGWAVEWKERERESKGVLKLQSQIGHT